VLFCVRYHVEDVYTFILCKIGFGAFGEYGLNSKGEHKKKRGLSLDRRLLLQRAIHCGQMLYIAHILDMAKCKIIARKREPELRHKRECPAIIEP
jgi:hypothetical protein